MAHVERRLCGDRGVATTAVVLAVPAVLVAVMVVVQFALAYHARQIVTAAAQDAAFEASGAGAGPTTASETVARVLDLAGSELVHDVSVTVDPAGDRVRVEISAKVTNVIPGLTMAVTGLGESPRERFYREGEAAS